jgi:hypothetical protein
MHDPQKLREQFRDCIIGKKFWKLDAEQMPSFGSSATRDAKRTKK